MQQQPIVVNQVEPEAEPERIIESPQVNTTVNQNVPKQLTAAQRRRKEATAAVARLHKEQQQLANAAIKVSTSTSPPHQQPSNSASPPLMTALIRKFKPVPPQARVTMSSDLTNAFTMHNVVLQMQCQIPTGCAIDRDVVSMCRWHCNYRPLSCVKFPLYIVQYQ